MASTYSNLKIQLMATGENSGTWGNVTNANLGDAIEQAIVETATVTFASANVTLTLSDSNSKQDARALRLNLTGTTAGARDLIVPAIQKPYLVNNGTADTITVKVSGQTGVAVPASTSMLLYNNGTDVVVAFNRVVGNLVGTASNATVLQTARNIQISGNVTAANVSFNGSADVNLNVTAINAAGITSGTLPEGRGGTGETTYTNGQLLIGSTPDGGLTKATLTAGTGITITNGAGSITVAAAGGGGLNSSQLFTNPGNFSAPPTTNAVYVVVQGAGGGGGGASGNLGNWGGWGGGGGLAIGVVPVTGGSNYSITVGTGGNGGAGNPGPTNNASAGNPGNASSFSNLISANGGGGGGGAVNTPPLQVPGNTGAGGNGVAPTGIPYPTITQFAVAQFSPANPRPPSTYPVWESNTFGRGGNVGTLNPGSAGNAGGTGFPGFVFVAF
jgi:hypothetical protein